MTDTTTLRTPDELISAGLAAPGEAAVQERIAARYAVAIPPALAALIDRNDPADPIARQFVPDVAELDVQPHELADPIGDAAHMPVEGIVHRYPDRVLLKLVHVCAVYCRFCFRREMVGPGKPNALSSDTLGRALDYIRATPAIWEVILTGGDPLVISPRRLQEVMTALAAIPHVKIVRIHTRLPVADPAAITDALVDALTSAMPQVAVYVGLHANHPRELTPAARAACARLIDAGIPMVSQTVLLRGVNDTVETMGALLRALVETRIKPYYLHHGDLAPGTAHLRTTIAQGQALMRELRGRFSGLCLPDYVLDLPGGHGKSPVGPNYVVREAGHGAPAEIEDYRGQRHVYPPDLT